MDLIASTLGGLYTIDDVLLLAFLPILTRTPSMYMVIQVLNGLVGLGALVCFVLILVKMFQNGQTAIAIVSIVTLCCGIGGIIALVYGWMKAAEWGIKNLMMIYSILFGVSFLLGLLGYAMMPAPEPINMDFNTIP